MPAELGEQAVQEALARRLAGSQERAGGVVWVSDGDEVVVWPESLRVALAPAVIRVRLDLETDQHGRRPQEVAIAVAAPSEAPSWTAVAGEPAGEQLAARWGATLQDAVWAALVDLAEADGPAAGIAAGEGTLVVHPVAP